MHFFSSTSFISSNFAYHRFSYYFVQVPFLQSTINEIYNADSEDALTRVLEKFDSPHHFERPEERNLLNWYKVLNRFDHLLERYISERNIFAKPPKTNPDPTPNSKPVNSSLFPSSSSSFPSSSQEAPVNYVSYPPFSSEPSVGQPSPSALDGKVSTESDSSKHLFTPSPNLIRHILRLTQRLIRNASHDTRNIYNSVEHILALLSDDNSAILLLTLEILNMLLQRPQKFRPSRVPLTIELSTRLLDLVVGWGGRENGLGMLECCSSNNLQALSSDGATLYYTYQKSTTSNSAGETSETEASQRDRKVTIHDPLGRRTYAATWSSRGSVATALPLSLSSPLASSSQSEVPVVSTKGSSCTIFMDDVSKFDKGERWLVTEFASRNAVPKHKLFSLLWAFRRAKLFTEGRAGRMEAVIIRLYAITTIFYMQPSHGHVHDLLSKEPELLLDIVSLAKSQAKDGVEDIPRCLRVIAIRCLTAMCSDRHRVSSIMAAMGVNVHHGALPKLLRAEITPLLSNTGEVEHSNDDDSGSDMVTSESESISNPGNETYASFPGSFSDDKLSLFEEWNRVSLASQRIQTTESLLALVHSFAVAAGSSGATPLANSGVLGILIPLLSNRDVRHTRIVAQAIRAMQAIIEGSAQRLGNQLFRDHDGLSLVASRIASELGVEDTEMVDYDQSGEDEAIEIEALKRRGETRALYERLGRRQMTPTEALDHQPPSSSITSRGLLPHSKWALLRALHQLLIIALGSGGNEVRELVVGSKLLKALRKIMAQPFLHGGVLFQSAATVTTDIAHAEPTATSELVKAGLATTVLRSISVGLPPCGEAVRCIPNLLAALCLAPSARDIIVSSKPLKEYLLRLATPFYTRALHGDIPVHIGSALDELMRHVEALRPSGNEAMIEYLRMSATFANMDVVGFVRSEKSNSIANRSPGYTTGKAENAKEAVTVANRGVAKHDGDGESTSSDEVLLHRMKLAVANNSCRLAGFAQGSSEHQEGIVKGGGLSHIISLRNAPALASPEASVRDGYAISRHYPVPGATIVSLATSLRHFSTRHGTAVLKSLFSVILKDAATVLSIASELDDVWLPEEENSTFVGREVDITKNSKISEDKNLLGIQEDETEGLSQRKKRSKRSSSPNDRTNLRIALGRAIRTLRVDVVLLSALSRGGPGSSSGAWENAGGSLVAAVISTVERAARFHLARVYTGLTLSASSDGDLSTAHVTAAADPTMRSLQYEKANQFIGEVNKIVGFQLTKSSAFEEACKRYDVPPEGAEPVRQDVKGLAWHLVTFAVAAQRLYSALSRGLTFSARRPSRDPTRYAASAKSLAATIGRIFALHLKAATPLWDMKVITMGGDRVVAAWDYVRGILIEIKGTLFDEARRSTQALILKSFLEAGGAQALAEATKPFCIVKAASGDIDFDKTLPKGFTERRIKEQEFDELLKGNSFSASSFLLAANEALKKMDYSRKSEQFRRPVSLGDGGNREEEDTVMSSDSVSNQARGISRIAVTDLDPSTDNAKSHGGLLRGILFHESYLDTLRSQRESLLPKVFAHCGDVAVRRIASDVWNTLCGFLNLFSSCPGLLNSHGPSQEPYLTGGDWLPRNLQRSAMTSVLDMLSSVTEHAEELLFAFRPDGTSMTDILDVMHTTAQVSAELCKKNNSSEPDVGSGEDGEEDEYQEPPEDVPASRSPSLDPDLLRSVMEMGFSERRARLALRQTAPGGIEYAMEWLLSNPEDPEESDDSDGPRDWDGEEQGEDGDENGEDDEGLGTENDAENGNSNDDVSEDENLQADGEEANNANFSEGVPSESPQEDDVMMDAPNLEDGNVMSSQGIAEETSDPVTSDVANALQEASRKEGDDDVKGTGTTVSTKDSLSISLESEGSRLIELSISKELDLLSSALEKSHVVTEAEVRNLCSVAEARVNNGNRRTDDKKKDDHKHSIVVSPVSIEVFKHRKKVLFDSFVNVIRAIFECTDSHVHGRHFPYIVVELLSVMRRDGTLYESSTQMFARVLCDGLKLALAQNGNQVQGKDARWNANGSTASIWAHYGGSRTRSALHACGAFRVSFDDLNSRVDQWVRSNKSPLVDKLATQPIRNLSIKDGNLDPNILRGRCEKGKAVEQEIAENDIPLKSKTLRVPTKQEALTIKQITTCLLLLDAGIRYAWKDKLIEVANSQPKEDGEEKVDSSGEKEKMDTDKNIFGEEGGNSTPRDETRTESQNHRLLQEFVGVFIAGRSSAADVDMTSAENEEDKNNATENNDVDCGEEDDLPKLRRIAKDQKKDAIDLAKKNVESIISVQRGSRLNWGISEKSLLMQCLRLLKAWKDIEAGDGVLAVLQVIAGLTKDWKMACVVIEKGGIDLLLSLPHLGREARSTDSRSVRLLVKTIIRHLLEDPHTLEEAMKSEVRSVVSGQGRNRSSPTLKSLLSTCAPLMARDLLCFVSSVANTTIAGGASGGSHVQLQEYEDRKMPEVKASLEERPNVSKVIHGLAGMLKYSTGAVKDESIAVHGSSIAFAKSRHMELPLYALECLSELLEVSQVAAVAFICTPSPSSKVTGSALDFVIQMMLPVSTNNEGSTSGPFSFLPQPGDLSDLSNAARKLFLALCSKAANTHGEAVAALARAAKLEANKTNVNPGVIRGIAHCIAPGTKLRILRAVLQSGLPNDLARSLKKLDLSLESNFEVAVSVLRALSLIGQASTHIARHGDSLGDDVSFGSGGSRDPWISFHERNDTVVHSPSYTVR